MNYALLVGINHYRSKQIADLRGCENDVDRFKVYLESHFGDQILINSLKSDKASRAKIIDGFQSHLSQAKEGDLALFYYSGHGSRERSPEAFYPFQSDQLHEGIVCHDSLEGSEDLADKELSLLIRSISKNGAEVVVVFDCCHSGSGTRNSKFEAIRQVPEKLYVRTKKSFLEGTYENLNQKPTKHLFFSACQKGELSRERKMGYPAKWGGIFTDVLLDALTQTLQPGLITYSNLEAACRMGMQRRLQFATQTPNMEAHGGFNIRKLFLQTSNDDRKAYVYSIASDGEGLWKIKLGAVHGLPINQTTGLSIYWDPTCKNYLGEATTSVVGLYESIISLPKGVAPRNNQVLYAVPESLALTRLDIWVEPELLPQFKELINELPSTENLNETNREFLLSKEQFETSIFLSSDIGSSKYGLIKASKKTVKLIFIETKLEVVPGLEVHLDKDDQGGFVQLAKGLLQIASWESLRNLQNQHFETSQIDPQIELNFINTDRHQKYEGDYATIDYTEKFNFELRIRNSGDFSLFCNSYYLSRHFQIEETDNKEIPNDAKWRTIDAGHITFPKEGGLTQITDIYTLILSKEKLPILDLGISARLIDNFIIQKDRKKGVAIEAKPIVGGKSNWFTKSFHIKLLKNLGQVGNNSFSCANDQIHFQSHKKFRAQINLLSSADHAHGSWADQYLKFYLESVNLSLYDFSTLDRQETILELHHIEHAQSLKVDPLWITLNLDIPDNIEIWVFTLPNELGQGFQNLDQKVVIPMISQLSKDGNNFYQLSLDSIPSNPKDGRTEPYNSLKLGFGLIGEQTKESIKQNVIHENGRDYFLL